MDRLNTALIDCVRACGGSKAVGPSLWPEKTAEAAQRMLLDCLNEDRPQNLSPSQVLLLVRMARERGCHAYLQFLSDELSYAPPVPVAPQDQADELRRRVLEMGRELQAVLARLDQVERPGPRAVA